jgi:hypothetical protein
LSKKTVLTSDCFIITCNKRKARGERKILRVILKYLKSVPLLGDNGGLSPPNRRTPLVDYSTRGVQKEDK